MSAETSGDVSLIKDEDLLRKMWQDTEDFGRKKEIRAHMYKLREARLRDFYNSGEITTDIQKTTTKTTTESKSTPTHADSLADHSFISMKTKEIRDSESPTRDVSYRITGDKGLTNQGWTTVTSNQKSEDGKTFTTSKIATTSGTEKIEGGKLDYAAKTEQQGSVYQDGDDRNFTKAVGASSNTVIKQEASGGDENSSFKTSSTKTSSSSKYVTEHCSTTGNNIENQLLPTKRENQDNEFLISRKTYTENIPSELKNHPSYIDGKTKVTRETRTLPDGTTVTTTRYEVKGGSTTQLAKTSHYNASEQRSSTVNTTQQRSSTIDTSQSVESKVSQNESKTNYLPERQPSSVVTVTRHVSDSRNKELQPATTKIITRTAKDEHLLDSVDNSTKSTIVYEPHDDSTITKKTTIIRKVYDYDSREEPSTVVDSNITRRTTVVENTDDVNKELKNSNIITKTTTVKNVHDTNKQQIRDDSKSTAIKTSLVKNIYDTRDQLQPTDDTKTTTTIKTTRTEHINDSKDARTHTEDYSSTKINRYQDNENFIAVEQQDTGIRMVPKAQTPEPSGPNVPSPGRYSKPEKINDDMFEKRQPIKPGKSELDVKPKPTEGQYETTYRTDFTNKRISVEVSPTHEAFARSLRAVSPDRISKGSSPSRGSLRNSTNSLRSSTSPEKNRHPSRLSPERRSMSPRKTTSNETITHKNKISTDIVTRRCNTTEIDSSTLTKRKNRVKTRSRSPSPTSIASDIEFIRNIVTDLDTNETTVIKQSRPSTLEVTKKTVRKVTDRFPTSPLTDKSSPKKSPSHEDIPRRGSLKNTSPTKTSSPSDKPLKRTDTYEERCRQILGITNETDRRKTSLERIATNKKASVYKTTTERTSPNKEVSSPTKPSDKKIQEFPSQIRKSPEKESSHRNTEKSISKDVPKINALPTSIRKSPEKESSKKYPDRKIPQKDSTATTEFPSQVRGTPEKETSRQFPVKKTDAPKITEFPSQIRKSPEKEPSENYHEDISKINQYSIQSRKTQERRPLQKDLENEQPEKSGSKICELPSPQKELLKESFETKRPVKVTDEIHEFTSQIRKTENEEILERYPEKRKPTTDTPKLNEFPSQIRKSSEKEPLEDFPEKKSSGITDFPTQIKKTQEIESLETFSVQEKSNKDVSKISEFPSQIRKSPEKEPLGEYPGKTRPEKKTPTISECPSQIKIQTQKREPLDKLSDKEKPERDNSKISEFSSQIKKPSEKESLGESPDKKRPEKETLIINEFPSQIRKVPEKEPLEKYSEKEQPRICKFPSQTRKSPEREVLNEYREKKVPDKETPQISEYPSQTRKSQEKEPSKKSFNKERPTTNIPKTGEFSPQIKKSPEKEPLKVYPEKKPPEEETHIVSDFTSQIKITQQQEPLVERFPDRERPIADISKISAIGEQSAPKRSNKEIPEFSECLLQTEKTQEKGPLEKLPDKGKPKKDDSKIFEPESKIPEVNEIKKYHQTQSNTDNSRLPSHIQKIQEKEFSQKDHKEKQDIFKINVSSTQIRKSEKEFLEEHADRKRPVKDTSKLCEFPPDTKESTEEQPLDKYLDENESEKKTVNISNIQSEEEEVSEHYLKNTNAVCKIPSQIKPGKESLKKPTQVPSPKRDMPDKIDGSLSQIKISPQKNISHKQPDTSESQKIFETGTSIRASERIKPQTNKEKYSETSRSTKDFLFQTKKTVEIKSKMDSVKADKTSSHIRKSPEKTNRPEYHRQKIHPTSPSKRDKPRTTSFSSLSSNDEKDIEEVNTVRRALELEGKIPVDEPLVTKKFIDQLCRDDEIQRNDLTEMKNQTLLNREMLETQNTSRNRTVKKQSPKKPQDIFVENERRDTTVTLNKYNSPRSLSPVKKSLPEKNNTTSKKMTASTKIDTKNTKKILTNDKPKLREKTTEKITLYDVENLNEIKEDNRIHIRTHRVDDTINKKLTRTNINDDVTKKNIVKRPQTTKPEELKTKKSTEKKSIHKAILKSVTETEKRLSTEQKSPKRHIVTTTITVSPKTRASPTKGPNKLIPSKTATSKAIKKPELQNGHISSDNESITDSLGDLTERISITSKQKGKLTSDQVIKKKSDSKTPIKRSSKPELSPSRVKQENKCITTKSIIINNDSTKREVIVDLQRSKSSREPTPDRICPLPVSSDDETTPRYPDQISEPDDIRHKPKRLSDIPIIEGTDVTEFRRITEIEDTSTENVDKVEETDESLLSVNKKINKFLDTSDKITKTKHGPAPKVERPRLEVNKDMESDECLLSVSQKVNKFITTAEQLTAPKDFLQRPKSPKCQYYTEDETSVSDKVAHFITTAENIVTSQKGIAPKSEKPNFENVDENIKEDDCLLSVSDKVSKFINTAEKLTGDSKKTINLSIIDVKPTQKIPEQEEPRVKIFSKEMTPTRKPSKGTSTRKIEVPENKYPRRDSSPKLDDSTPKSTRRPSENDPKSVLSPTGRLRSTESVRKAKALFENINRDEQVLKRDILSRPSVFEERKISKTETARKLEYKSEEEEEEEKVLKSTRLVIDKVCSRSKSPEKVQEVICRRSQTPDSDIPGYMKPLDRSLRPNSPHRENINQMNQFTKKYSTTKDEENVRQTKFGVTLKRTDSGRAITTLTSSEKSNITIEGITDAEIEQIYEVEILEELLEKVTDYDLRRKIRAQIRLLKKLISEGKVTEELPSKKITVREQSPVKVTKQSKESVQKTTTEYESYSYDERRSSSEYTKEIRRSQSPEFKRMRSKSPEKSSTKNTKIFQSQLKKTLPSSKATPEDNRPEWVKQRNLKKHIDVTTTTKNSTTRSQKFRSSPVKETKATDIITSSYGVGPTDENGSPLFGLKALRSRNKTDTSKVQGTMIRSQYYSENGEEPVGEISVTTYSSDPRDLGRNDDVKRKGITSITTTQKFGYKDTPSLKNLTSSKKKKGILETNEEVETKTTKVSRRGSVKALSQKFIENAVETSKSERQSSYPKAGLILRTSSFKESASSGDSREGSTERTVTMKTSSTKSVTGETFLTNRNKVTGVQDVISRMKTEDVREGDSVEDIEARGLLNKFIGAQVILSGIESNVKSSTTSTNAKRTTKVTTTLTEGGKPITKTRIFQHPISDQELESVWDEQTLRLLLEQSTDYDERRSIRARLRQVMAEQEACTELVERASQDQIGTTFEGESQLLPLLQGLLEAPDNEQTADSGTESGEDQRSGLIAEVQNALDKLSASLRDDTTGITPERRTSLLQLVTKLQAGLATSIPTQERRSSVQGRFRRRQRPNRHTVGVSSEELADARRLIQEISLQEITPSQSKISLLQKQNSEGTVGQNSSSSFKPFTSQKTSVKNAVAKPFSSSNSTISGNSSSVQTPTDPSESLDLLFNEDTCEKKPDFAHRSISMDDQKIRRSSSEDISYKSVQHAVQVGKDLRKSNENLLESEETTDEDTTVKAQTIKLPKNTDQMDESFPKPPQQDVVMQNNPIYHQQKNCNIGHQDHPIYYQEKITINDEKNNKFNSKKLKMKRANTIDIPKPLKFYEDNDDSDCSLPEEDYNQRRRSNYLALRGPIRIGNPANNKNTVPVFEPKTDNDKKFLAFISKHNENSAEKNSLWSKPEPNKGNIWSNKFGNIKTTFEKVSASPNQSQNSARQFWKSADDAVTSGPKYDGPKISKQSARNLRQMFEEKQKQSQKLPWGNTQNDKNIVTGSLKVKGFESNEKSYKFVPQPLPVNKFSHAPQSAFKPLPKKVPPTLEIPKTIVKSEVKEKDLDSPLFLYSPKPSQNESSLKPWAASPGESRVLSLAASKFENIPQQEVVTIKPKKMSKDKVFLPFQQQPPEKLTAPYLVKTVEQKNSNIVRQLSGQYDNLGGKNNEAYSTYSTVKYTSPKSEKMPSYNQQYNKAQHYANQQYNPHYNVQNEYSAPSQQYYSQTQHRGYHNQQYQAPQAHHYTYQNQNYPPLQNQTQYTAQNQSYANSGEKLSLQNHENAKPNSQYCPSNQYKQQYEFQPQQYKNQNDNYVQDSCNVQNYYYSNQPQQYTEPQYTSTYQYQPQTQIPSPKCLKQLQSEEHHEKIRELPKEIECKPPKLDSQISVENLKEYNAVSSRVMTGPVCQQATTIRQKSPMNRDEHEMAAALNLKNSLQKVTAKSEISPQKVLNSNTSSYDIKEKLQKTNSPINYNYNNSEESQKTISPINYDYGKKQFSQNNVSNYKERPQQMISSPNNLSCQNKEEPQSFVSSVNYNYKISEDSQKNVSPTNYSYKIREEPKRIVSPNSFSYRPRKEIQKPVSPHSFSYKSKEDMQNMVSVGSYKYRSDNRTIPVESLEINDDGESIVTSKFQIPVINVPLSDSLQPPSQAQIINKGDAWKQICMQNQQPLHKPSPRASPNSRTIAKSKSTHSLAVPKQFEAGMSKDEMAQKRKTMEAFFGNGSKSPQPSNENSNKSGGKIVKRSINRLKSSEKMSTCHQSSGLSRSRTLPDIVCADFLDETNVDKAFEDLFKSSS